MGGFRSSGEKTKIGIQKKDFRTPQSFFCSESWISKKKKKRFFEESFKKSFYLLLFQISNEEDWPEKDFYETRCIVGVMNFLITISAVAAPHVVSVVNVHNTFSMVSAVSAINAVSTISTVGVGMIVSSERWTYPRALNQCSHHSNRSL